MERKPNSRDTLSRALAATALVVGIAAMFFPNSTIAFFGIGSQNVCTNGTDGTNGTNGTDGKDGTNGTDGTNGQDGTCGPVGPAGANGLSALEVWQKENPEGTYEDYLAAITGPQGLQGIQGIQGVQGLKGDTGDRGPAGADGVNGLGDYASFYDTTTQNNPVVNGVNIMTYNNTVQSHGITVVDGSKITFTKAGVYNIAFSAQLDKTDSGQDQVAIWLAKNGNYEDWSATMVDANNNNAKVVAAWNFFVEVQAGDYYQLKWKSADADLRLYAQPTNAIPGIPSIILTVNQVG